jgi:hypothetical protein
MIVDVDGTDRGDRRAAGAEQPLPIECIRRIEERRIRIGFEKIGRAHV